MDRINRIWLPPAILPLVLLTLLTLQVSQAQAQNYQGEVSLDGYSGNDYTITSIKVKYHFSTLFQEPLKKYHMWWESDDPSLSITSIKFRARVENGVSPETYIFFSPAHIPKQQAWGQDVAASPDWGNLFHQKNGAPLDGETAKSIYKSGFTLKDLEVVDIAASKKKDGPNSGKSADDHKQIHERAGALLRTLFKNKEDYTENKSKIDDFLHYLQQNVSQRVETGWGQGGNPISQYEGDITCQVRHAKDVYSPQISRIINEVGSYFYVFIKIGPLYGLHCPNGVNEAPVALKIKMELKTQDSVKVRHSKTFEAETRLIPGEVVTFADRIANAAKQRNDLAMPGAHGLTVSVDVTPKATQTCNETEKQAKNPFEKQIEEEKKAIEKKEREERARIAKKKMERKRFLEKAISFLSDGKTWKCAYNSYSLKGNVNEKSFPTGAIFSINGKDETLDENGDFNKYVELQEGKNNFELSINNKVIRTASVNYVNPGCDTYTVDRDKDYECKNKGGCIVFGIVDKYCSECGKRLENHSEDCRCRCEEY